MFQFTGLALFRVLCLQHSGLSHSEIYGYNAIVTGIPLRVGFPIRTSPDQSLFDGSPKLFAVYNVLHRL